MAELVVAGERGRDSLQFSLDVEAPRDRTADMAGVATSMSSSASRARRSISGGGDVVDDRVAEVRGVLGVEPT